MTPVVLDRKQVAGVLMEIGTLLELKGENPFKARACTARRGWLTRDDVVNTRDREGTRKLIRIAS